MSGLTKEDKLAIAFLVPSTLSDLVLIILLSLHLNYTFTSKKNTSPTYTTVDNPTCSCDDSQAKTNPVSIDFTQTGAGLYTCAIASLAFCLITIGTYIKQALKNKTKSDTAVLGVTGVAGACNLVIIILLVVPLTYNVNAFQETLPVLNIDPSKPQKATTTDILINYLDGGIGIYTCAILGFVSSFIALDIIWEIYKLRNNHNHTTT